jgi:hypothetical protein
LDREGQKEATVGATPENAPVIKESYWRVLRALDGHVRLNRYLFGSRPSLADFGWFGMLKTLATDTTPMMEMREAVPMVEHWARQVDDISGLELGAGQGEWIAGVDDLPDATVELLGKPYAQGPFPYQVKCLQWLREELAALSPAARDSIRPLLEETKCWNVLAPS